MLVNTSRTCNTIYYTTCIEIVLFTKCIKIIVILPLGIGIGIGIVGSLNLEFNMLHLVHNSFRRRSRVVMRAEMAIGMAAWS